MIVIVILFFVENVSELDLNECDNITDAGLEHLKNVQRISLRFCSGISPQAANKLRQQVAYLAFD